MNNSSKLPQKKLAFSLEQIITFAKLTHKIQLITENPDTKALSYAILCQSANSFHKVLNDQYIQVTTVRRVFWSFIY